MIDLILGDCLEVMKTIKDNSINMVLCDLPYNTTGMKWDIKLPLDKLWEQYNRIIKDDGVICLTAAQPFTSELVMSNREMFMYEWIWDKHIARGMHRAKEQPMRKHENILIFSKTRKHKYNPIMVKRDKPVTVKNYIKRDTSGERKGGRYKDNTKTYTYTHKNPTTIITGKWEANKGKLHPTQKPVSLMEYLIETYTNDLDYVLDNTMGSGSTMVACQNLNRNGIGIEQDEKYFKIAQDRIKENEYKLF
mgnify:CR=1 FL=1